MPKEALTIAALIGSPRHQNTLHVVEVIEDELKKLGPVKMEYIFLAERNIEPCRGCMACMANGWECCPLRDDMQDILDTMGRSDGMVLASPVYIFHVTSQTKKFLDRLPSFCHRPAFLTKHAMAVSTTGIFGTGPTLKYMSNTLGVLGFRTVVSVGGKGLDDGGGFNKKLEAKARVAARRFHRNLSRGDSIQPSFGSIMQFRMQRMVCTSERAGAIFPADHEHFIKLKGRPYGVDAPIDPFTRAAAWIGERLMAVITRFL